MVMTLTPVVESSFIPLEKCPETNTPPAPVITSFTPPATGGQLGLGSFSIFHVDSARTKFSSQGITCSPVKLLLKGKKVKEVDLYSAFIEVPYTRGAQVRITQCYLQTTPYLPLPRKHSPDGASQTEVADI